MTHLHEYARLVASALGQPDKKQLRFNDIVDCALEFYPKRVYDGIREIVQSCDKECKDLYVKGLPMWKALSGEYGWIE